MSQAQSQSEPTPAEPKPSALVRFIAALGAPFGKPSGDLVRYLGGVTYLLVDTVAWFVRSFITRKVRFGRLAFYSQIVRLGVNAVGVITLVSACIGLILALQMEPTLRTFNQVDKVANIIAIAVVRELGPLISAVVLTGFAGASIAAELGTMVVGEEIEALEAHALNPVRFLVLPRVLATMLCLLVLCVIGMFVAITAGWTMGVLFLDIEPQIYYDNTIDQLKLWDFVTGMLKAGVFGVIIAAISCFNGLAVRGGAAGVGRATTNTVVHSIVAIICADLLFTAIFFTLGWN